MAPANSQTLLSPAELSYIHSSLSSSSPIRADLRGPTQFRPLIAETDILPNTNGSARVCFSDGTEALVGIKAEVEKTSRSGAQIAATGQSEVAMRDGDSDDEEDGSNNRQLPHRTSSDWLEIGIELPGFRDDDSLPVFLSSTLTESLLASGRLMDKLYINERWHWRLYIDVLSLSAPLSYPLPLMSMTIHLALLNTALPRLTSEPSDDPLFDDDWAAAVPLYDRGATKSPSSRPPVTLLVMTVGSNIFFDPSKEELAAAESALAVSFVPQESLTDAYDGKSMVLKLLAVRTLDPPSRSTPLGSTHAAGAAMLQSIKSMPNGTSIDSQSAQDVTPEQNRRVVWSPPRGGLRRDVLKNILKIILEPEGVGHEVLDGLAHVET
ncbi:MAG: hypothetical protein M1828_002732 [Chrysothrix sp. TS-e1954]|nr:MAG: hypothetical protein M1828_002732 [Chrysothrix sp. TS-e1954]